MSTPKVILVAIASTIFGFCVAMILPRFIFPSVAVTIVESIDLPEDGYFYDESKTPNFMGRVEAGSTCKQTFRKGHVRYVSCAFVVDGSKLEEAS